LRGTLPPWKNKTQQPHGARNALPNRLLKPLSKPGNLRPRRTPLPSKVIPNLNPVKERLPPPLPVPAARNARAPKAVTGVIAIAADADAEVAGVVLRVAAVDEAAEAATALIALRATIIALKIQPSARNRADAKTTIFASAT
jgi:hypothetical protein